MPDKVISFQKQPNTDKEIYNILNPVVAKWFKNKFNSFATPQKHAILPIHSRENILVSSPTGSGKCITPDESILLNVNGQAKVLTGEDLIKLTKKGNLIKKIDKKGELFDLSNLESYSLKNYQIRNNKALVYVEDFKGSVYRVKTEYGREVKLTSDHPMLVERNGKEEWVPIKEIRKGEKIGVPKKIDLPQKEIKLEYTEAVRNLRKKGDRVITYTDFVRLKKKNKEFQEF